MNQTTPPLDRIVSTLESFDTNSERRISYMKIARKPLTLVNGCPEQSETLLGRKRSCCFSLRMAYFWLIFYPKNALLGNKK